MAVDNRSTSSLFKRAEQLRRWQESETNKQEVLENNRTRKVNFSDGCIFLAACSAGDKQEVLRLLEKGADIDTANVDGLTALHAACIDDNLDMVEFLVEQGTDVNKGDMEGWTPLHATASCGFNSIAKFLIDRGADLSLVNNDGDLAIDIADSDEMESLLQREIECKGIDCDVSRNEEERRMLDDAQQWLSSGCLSDRPHPKTGAVALHVAAAKGYIKVMRLLLEAGADINVQDLDGWTPLHAAAHWGQREAVEILCENMADMDVRNFVGQSAFDVADSSLLRLMDELKRKQAALKLVNQNKQTPRKRKTSPHRDHSNKKEREDHHESDGTSGDESSSDVEKKNKVNKENATPQIIPTSVVSDKSSSRTLPQTRAENAIDESEVQSWRRPSSLRKTNIEDKNQKEEASQNISTRVNNKENDDNVTGKRVTPPEKDESSLSATRERLKARSCPALSQLEEEEGRDGGGGVWAYPQPQSHSGGIASSATLSSSSALVTSQRLSSSDINLPLIQNHPDPPLPSVLLSVQNSQSVTIAPTFVLTVTTQSTCTVSSSSMSTVTSTFPVSTFSASSPTEASHLLTSVTTATTTITMPTLSFETQTTATRTTPHKPVGRSISSPVPSIVPIPNSSSLHTSIPPSEPPSSSLTAITTNTTTTAGLASLSTNQTTNNKDPRLLARSASLRERIQRNHMDSMEPLVSTGSVHTTNTSPSTRSVGRSFVPPSRDEESETQRKAHAKMVRSTRRSTQGVTLEDIKSAEQLMKNKQQQVSTSSPEPKETSSAPTVPTSTPQGSSTTTPSSPSSKPKPESPTKADEEERRPSWRLKVDDSDKNRFSLENVRTKDKSDVENDTETVTVQLRKKNTEEKGDEDKESERNSQTREGTQAAIQRRKKPKRRSTGVVKVNIDEIDPEKRAQRSAEQQQQQQQKQQQADEGSEEEEEEDKPSANEHGETVKGSTTSLGSAINSRPSSRSSSVGPENGDIDYKKLYEEQLEENFRVHERLRGTENELRQTREAIDLNNKKCNTRLAMAEADKREKRALERKLSEMEEELKLLEQLKQENQRLKDENGALIRVISKLSK